ncbi:MULTISPECIES: hypothetical protein [unclassified Streptomyces]|uniref:hypothetical protein n=1 Tax=unclassified Streptomyces TaxID=2593676 RepID=UPI0036EDE585
MSQRFSVDDVVHVRDDATGHRWDTTGFVTAVYPDSPHPYGVDIPGQFGYARFAADEVSDALAHTGRAYPTETIVGRTAMFGKSYMWTRVGGRLELRPDFTQRWLFSNGERHLMERWRRSEQLAYTGRPSRAGIRAAAVGASVATVAALAIATAPDATSPGVPPMTPIPVVTEGTPTPQPYLPEPRPTTHTTREGERETLTPLHSATLATPSTTPRTKHPIATPPADIRISYYRDCSGNAQPCIDAGALTMYAGRILAGHNYMGYQWLSRVPVGRTVRVISGPLAGTYKVYGHLRINRQGGAIPAFEGAALVLQTCEGSGTGFSLLRRA